MKKIYMTIFILLIVLGIGFIMVPNNPSSDPIVITKEATIFEKQAEIEHQIQAEYQATHYSLKNPYIHHDPYQNSPLSYLIKFETEKPAKLQVNVMGKTKNADLTYDYDDYKTSHDITLIGLYPEYNNQITITAFYEDSSSESHRLELATPNLSKKYINPKVTQMNPNFDELNLYLINDDQYKYIIDSFGDIRYAQLSTSGSLALLQNGNFLTYNFPYFYYYQIMLEEVDLLGRVHQTYYIPGAGHHSLYEMNDGNILINSSDKTDEAYIEDVIYTINRENGNVIETINLRDYLDITRFKETLPQYVNESNNDWFHLNYAMYDEQDQTIIASGRSQSMVVKIDPKTEELKWILGPHDEVNDTLQPYLLTPIGDLTWPFAQHSAKVLPDIDQNPKTTDVILLDNHVDIGVFPREIYTDLNQYSRGVHYRINEENMTVEQLWEFGSTLGTEVLSTIISEIDYLEEDRSFLVLFGFVDSSNLTGGKLFEVNSTDATDVKFSMDLLAEGTNHIYTAQKIKLNELNIETSQTELENVSHGHKNLNQFKQFTITSDHYNTVQSSKYLISSIMLKDNILSLKGFLQNLNLENEVKLILTNEQSVNYEFSISNFDIHQVLAETELPQNYTKNINRAFKKKTLYRFTDFTDLSSLPRDAYRLSLAHTTGNKVAVYDTQIIIHLD